MIFIRNISFFSIILILTNFIFPSFLHAQTVALVKSNTSPLWDKLKDAIANKKSLKDIQTILGKTPINEVRGKDNNTLLIDAAQNGNIKETETLLQLGADINLQNDIGLNPLLIAIFNNDKPLFEFLMSQKPNIEIQDSLKRSPLHVATIQNNFFMLKALVEKKASLESRDINGWTPLFFAINNNNLALSEYLIHNGANVNAKSNLLKVPLHLAVQNKNVEIVKLLIKNGAKVNQRDKVVLNPQTPLDINQSQISTPDISNNTAEIEQILKDHQAKTAHAYFRNSFSLSTGVSFGTISENIIKNLSSPLNVMYFNVTLNYYIIPELSLFWNYSYGLSSGYNNYHFFRAPGFLVGLQNIFSLFSTSYKEELSSKAKTFYYVLFGLSSILPSGISWNIYPARLEQWANFSITGTFAEVNYITPKKRKKGDPSLIVDVSGLVGGKANLLFGEHFTLSAFFNIGISYTKLDFVWNIGFNIGALF
jgi:ankyrin repeat protein